jgi:hypothetical protein
VDLLDRPGAGLGIDREPLPGDAAERERRPERLAQPSDGQRADHVAAAPDPEDEHPPRGFDPLDHAASITAAGRAGRDSLATRRVVVLDLVVGLAPTARGASGGDGLGLAADVADLSPRQAHGLSGTKLAD